MSHNHTHCAHAHLSFCATCQVVYCHDCTQEWTPKVIWLGTTYNYANTATGLGFKSMTNAECPVAIGNVKPHTHGG